MSEIDINYEVICDFITTELKQNHNELSKESIDWISHYVEHDECEYAFEYLMLDYIEKNIKMNSANKGFVLKMGVFLNLENDQQYDEEFWSKFLSYLGRL